MQEQDVVADIGGQPHVMGDDDHGAVLGGQILDDAHDLLLKLGVQRAGRLVEQQCVGLHAQRAGNGGALLLAAR